jgi:hypothetical protein
VIDLPVGLALWGAQLAILPSDLALTLAPWIGRLALAVGPLASVHGPHSGEPDGYGGLSRRGSYERLVTAEWGLADLFPDEFLRRAAAGEHLFLDLARREPRGDLRSIAIVSAGPSQLGAPRLAHIALLIVLARRAAAAGASFSWGVLEDREHRLNAGLDAAGIQRLLAARTALPAGADAFNGWMAAIGGDDVWVVGAEDDTPGASRIVVRDVLEPGVRALDVEIARRGPSARVRLELPAPALCARLLRDPFASRRAPAPKVEPLSGKASAVRFAPGGRRVIVQLADDSFESWPLPSSPRDKVGHPRTWTRPRNHQVVAVGIGHRSILAATASPDDPTALDLSYSNNHRVRVTLPNEVASALARRFKERTSVPLGTCAIVRLRNTADLVLHVLDRLLVVPGFKLWPEPGTVRNALPFNVSSGELAPVVGSAFFHTRVVWAELYDDSQLHVMEGTSSGNRRVATVPTGPVPDVHFGFATPPSTTWGVMSAAGAARRRNIASPDVPFTTFEIVGGAVGVCLRDGEPSILQASILVATGETSLVWRTRNVPKKDRIEVLPTSGSRVVDVAVCPAQPNVAWVTDTGEVVVYSMTHKAVLFRRASGDAP